MKSSRLALVVFATAVIVGAATYFVQDQRIQQLQKEIADSNVQTQEAQMKEMKSETEEDAEIMETSELESKLPVVVYERPGLLTDEMRQEIEGKIIHPFFDYYNAKGLDFIVMIIEIPAQEGQSYTVMAVSKDGVYHGFLHGTRGETLEYYVPECMGPCPFTDEYKEKYPHVVAEE